MKLRRHFPKGVNMNNRGCKPMAEELNTPCPRRGRIEDRPSQLLSYPQRLNNLQFIQPHSGLRSSVQDNPQSSLGVIQIYSLREMNATCQSIKSDPEVFAPCGAKDMRRYLPWVYTHGYSTLSPSGNNLSNYPRWHRMARFAKKRQWGHLPWVYTHGYSTLPLRGITYPITYAGTGWHVLQKRASRGDVLYPRLKPGVISFADLPIQSKSLRDFYQDRQLTDYSNLPSSMHELICIIFRMFWISIPLKTTGTTIPKGLTVRNPRFQPGGKNRPSLRSPGGAQQYQKVGNPSYLLDNTDLPNS